MIPKKNSVKSDDETRASVTREMSKPRQSKSARIAEQNLDPSGIADRPSAIMCGTVHRIIPSSQAGQPEMAEIVVEGGGGRHRDFRFENTLTDENGDDVKLKKGDQVEIKVTDESKWATA